MTSRTVSRYLSQPYARTIMPDEQGGYAAQILEFPGCLAEGASPEEAYSNLEVAAEAWIRSADAQGIPIPGPFASQGYSGTISLRLPRSLHRRAALFARRDNVSLNQAFVAAIAAWVGEEELGHGMMSRIDERLERLEGARFAIIGVAERIAGTSAARLPPPSGMDLSKLQAESATSSNPYTPALAPTKEE